MKPAILLPLMIFLCGSTASARIGESDQQCMERYTHNGGLHLPRPTEKGFARFFEVEDYRIRVEFLGKKNAKGELEKVSDGILVGACVRIDYTKKPTGDGFPAITEKEIAHLLKINSPGKTWEEVQVPKSNKGPTRKWVTTDKTMDAVIFDPDQLKISTVEANQK